MAFSWFSAGERRRRAAATWFVRMRGEKTEDLKQRFDRWVSSPENAEAYRRIERSFDSAALLRLSGTEAGRDSAPRPAPKRAGRSRMALAAAAAFALAIPGGWMLLGSGIFSPGSSLLLVSTSVGERRTIELADGSRILLDTDSAVEYEPGKTPGRAVLRRGRARFVAASPDRPFRVEAAGTRAEAGRAMFDMALLEGNVSVASLSGLVSLRSGKESARIGAGSAATADDGHILRGAVVDPDWPSGMLEFRGESLGSAIGRANRYSRRQIRLSAGTHQLRVTGAHRAGDQEGLARSISVAFGLALVHLPGGDIELRLKSP